MKPKTFIDIKNLAALAKSNGCKYLNDVQADINELATSNKGSKFIWIVAKNGTLLQPKNKKLSSWFERYKRNCCSVYELTIDLFDEISILPISLEQAQIELSLAA